MTYDDVARRLAGFVHALLGDVRFRRRLRYRPAQALAEHGLPAADAPAELPVRHWTIEVSIDLTHLCGGVEAPAATAPPLAARLVALGARPLALVHGGERELVGLRRWGEAHGLIGLLSPWQLTPRTDAGKGGFSNLADETPAVAGSGAGRALLLAADAGQAMLGWLALLCRWDAFLGRLLGYPPCCADAFAARWAEAREHHQGDVAGVVAKVGGDGPFPWPLNPFLRYGGLEAVPHFPCRWDCAPSLDLARRLLAVLDRAEPAHAEALRRELPALVLYTETSGVFATADGQLRARGEERELVAALAAVRTTAADSPLAKAWAAGAPVVVGPAGEVRAGEVTTAGWLVDFRGSAAGCERLPDAAPAPLAPWLAIGSGIVEPAAGGRLLELARLDLVAATRARLAALADEVAAWGEPPRDVARFGGALVAHFAGRELVDLVTALPHGRATAVLESAAVADATEGRRAAGMRMLGSLAGAVAGHLGAGSGVVVPHEAFAGAPPVLDAWGVHAVLTAAGGPVALRGPDDRSGGEGTVVTWADGAAVRFAEPPAEAWPAAGPPRLAGGARVDGWPVLGVDASGAWRVAVRRGDGRAAALAPVIAGRERSALADGLALAGALCPGWLQAAQRGVEALAVVPPGEQPQPLPDVLAIPADALSPNGVVLALTAEGVATYELPQPLAAAVALAGAEGRRRVVLGWPRLARGAAAATAAAGGSGLGALWRAAAASRLAEAVGTLDGWRVLVATAERLVGGDTAAPLPEPVAALLRDLLAFGWPDAGALAAELVDEAAEGIAAELAAAAKVLRRRTEDVLGRAERLRERGAAAAADAAAAAAAGTEAEASPGAAPSPPPAAAPGGPAAASADELLLLSAADVGAAAGRFARDGVCELPAPLLAGELFSGLAAESVEQASHAWASDRASPPQSCWRAELGPLALAATARLLQPLAETVTGRRLALSREASCYTYYVGPGSFGGRHQDRAGACTVTCLVYLHAEAPGPPSPGMTLQVWRAGEPASVPPFAVVPTAANLGVVLLGSQLPHERPQLAAGEKVSLLALCFGLADDQPGTGAA